MITTVLLALTIGAPAPHEQAVAMTTYQMVFLMKGPNHDAVAKGPDAQKMQQQHLANLIALNQKRVNLLFGPLLDENELQGILVLDVPDAAAAAKAMDGDPYVKAGAMTVTVRPWFGPKDYFNLPAEGQQLERLVLGFLVRGSNSTQTGAAAEEIQKGHLAYMSKLHDQGKLLVAGPFMDDTPVRGIVIYRVATVDEAKALAAEDPAVKAGRLVLDAHPWMTFKGILK
jgi:uncharacterized protein YciI